jgi:putative sigma-54 modulation protein
VVTTPEASSCLWICDIINRGNYHYLTQNMNIKIRAVNFDLTPAIEEYVNKKISSLEKFLDKNENNLCEVELGRTTKHHKSGDIFKAELNIVESGNRQFYAVAEESDLYSAIDIVRDEAERRIVSKKEKKKTLFRRGSSRIKSFIKNISFRGTKWK